MNIRKYLWSIVEDNTTKKGKVFDYFIQVLIFSSLLSFSIETLPNLPEWSIVLLKSFETLCIYVFLVEYFLRVFVAKNPFKYIFSFYGIIDFLAIAPYFLSSFVDLRFLRVFRIFRIFRVLKLVRYNKAIRRLGIAAKEVKEEVILFLIVTFILIFVVSAGIYFFENEAQPDKFQSVFHSMWWTIVTLTTVGYGDVYPITAGGKIFTFFILILGLGIVTVPAGLVASSLSKAREIE
ncbi:MAG: ion transporter [Pseudomonadales bacterium]